MTRQFLVITMLVLVTAGWSSLRSASAHPKMDCNSCHVSEDGGAQTSAPSSVPPQLPAWGAPPRTTFTRNPHADPNPFGLSASLASELTDYYRGSKTLNAQIHAPDGASRMCLSCHDGSNKDVAAAHTFGPGGGMGALQNSHPVSFVYDQALASADGELKPPSALPHGVLDVDSKMQCTSCHEVHAHGQQYPKSLRWPYDRSRPETTAAFCRQCHVK